MHSFTTKNRDIYQSFHRAEEQMKQVLKTRKAEIKVSVCFVTKSRIDKIIELKKEKNYYTECKKNETKKNFA